MFSYRIQSTDWKLVLPLTLVAAAAGCGGGPGTEASGQTTSALEVQDLRGSNDGDGDGDDRGFAGALYVMTNGIDANAVVHYGRRDSGELVQLETVATGGRGVGSKFIPLLSFDIEDPLLAQNTLVLRSDHRVLVATNPGDDTSASSRCRSGAGPRSSRIASRPAAGFPSRRLSTATSSTSATQATSRRTARRP